MVYGCTIISLQRGVLNRDIFIDGFSTVLDLKGDINTLWVYEAAYMDIWIELRLRSAAQNL